MIRITGELNFKFTMKSDTKPVNINAILLHTTLKCNFRVEKLKLS